MTVLKFKFEWYDEAKSALRLIALHDWTWRDYHTCVRVVSVNMLNLPENSVHSIIDLRESERDAMPSGLVAHMRTFGKRTSPALTGHAVVIGFPPEARAQLTLEEDGTFSAVDGKVYFADDEDALKAQLEALGMSPISS